MKVLGLITEYNPFHNGHLYHLQESLARTGASHSVAVMSGNFLQRGEPALLHKWARAKMAVLAGVDLVIELPTAYACATAELFAFGAVKLLDSLGIVDTLCFGSEAGNLKELQLLAKILVRSPLELEEKIQAGLKAGLSYPAARGQGLIAYLNQIDSLNQEEVNKLKRLIQSPNNILSIEYLKALYSIKSKIIPETILRKKAPYHGTRIEAGIVSATAIREHLKAGKPLLALKDTVPATSLEVLEEAFHLGHGPIFTGHFDQVILALLRRSSGDELREVFDVKEGLENRILQRALHHTTLEGLLFATKSKRYPLTRLQRILFHYLLGIKTGDITSFQAMGGPQYARILAFNNKGRQLIKTARLKASIPLINKINQFKAENEEAAKMLSLDIRAADLYRLAMANTPLGAQPMEYILSPHYIPI
ncbi:nucleotidyltransferase [Alkaliphilus crotonatoxidans]